MDEKDQVPPPIVTTLWNSYQQSESGWIGSAKYFGYGERSEFEAFESASKQSAFCGLRTLNDYNREYRLWHQGLNLWRHYLARDFSLDQSNPVWESQSLRLHIQRMAFNTSRVILELSLDGAYAQSFALLRFQFEAWQRIVYFRSRPQMAHSWLSKNGNPPMPPNQGSIQRIVRIEKSIRDGAAAYAEQRVNEYDLFAHPTYQSLPLGEADTEGKTSLNLMYLPGAAAPILTNAIISNTLLIEELSKITEVDEPWHSKLNAHLSDVDYIMVTMQSGQPT